MEKHTVLLVDDEEQILNSLKRLLRKEPFDILAATSGTEGLALLTENPVQLILSDQRMPEMDGTEFFQKAKYLVPDAVRVILSGYADVGVIVESINKGEVYRFLSKPWNDDELKLAIRQCLEHHDILKSNRELVEKTTRQNELLQTLNQSLEEMVDFRTRSLQLAQGILQSLPLATIGISDVMEVVLVNDEAIQIAPWLGGILPGMDVSEVFPTELLEMVRHCIQTRQPSQAICTMHDSEFDCIVQPINCEAASGCLLVLKNTMSG